MRIFIYKKMNERVSMFASVETITKKVSVDVLKQLFSPINCRADVIIMQQSMLHICEQSYRTIIYALFFFIVFALLYSSDICMFQ